MSQAVATPQATFSVKPNRDPAALRRTALVAALVCAGYYLTAKIGFAFSLQPGSVSTLWMPNAILLAALLLIPKRFWWIAIFAAFPAHFAAEMQSGVPAAMVMSWFVSNALQALIAAVLMNHFVKGGARFDSLKSLTIFFLCAAFLAPFLSSFIDLALVRLNGWGNTSFWEAWRVRFLSNVLATVTLVPVIITWADGGFAAVKRAPHRRWAEALFLGIALVVVSNAAFVSQSVLPGQTPALLFWPLPFLLWATVRFGPRGLSTLMLLVMLLAIYGATQGHGPFVAHSSLDNAVSIQWFLIVVSVPLMSLAAVIAERQDAQKALRQTEARLVRTEAFSLVMITNVGLDGRWLKVPPTLCELVGYSEEELLAGTFEGITHPDDFEADWSQCQRVIRGEIKSFDLEKRYLHKNGRTIWVYLNCSIVEDDQGKPVHFLTYIQDITDRKFAEQALVKSSARNQAILRALPDIMFLHTKDGVYVDYHTRDPRSLLVPPEAFLGKNLKDVLPRELTEKIMECVGRLDSTDEPQVLEYSLPISDEERHFEARLVGAGADNVLSIVRDVTETRRAADALRRGEEKLLESNRKIRELAARLITAQESERRRISLLLHDDVSQNIAALGVAVSRLKRKQPDSSAQIKNELDFLGQQISALTTQIRQLSHQLHPEVLEHVGLVAALEQQVAEFGHEEHIEVQFKARVGKHPIPLDISVSLYRVALEALRNVSRHSGAGSAAISLMEDEGVLTLEISDSGKGFDVERARRGSGIGLISAEERLKLLQGTFDVKTAPELGTTIVARIPLVR